jgi:hypothetical protein
MKKNKLSHTSISKYLECNKKFDLHYNKKIRPINIKSALIFGGCLDSGLNLLFEGKTIEDAKKAFFTKWSIYENNPLVMYSKSDLDENLLKAFNLESYHNRSWASLLCKGELMIEACSREIIPNVKEVIAVQKKITFKNDAGDEIAGTLDVIIKSKDDKTYLMDNKSSSIKYESDSPKKSQQLVLYYYIEKDTIKIDEVGFFVFSKKINMNKLNTCNKCGFKSKTSHKTCNAETDGKRCNGDWITTFDPVCEVDIITNVVDSEDENRVINDIDRANEGIKNEEFEPNFSACEGIYGKCEYYNYCHGDSMEGLKVVGEKKDD